MLPWILLCAFACAGVLVCERRGLRAGVWVAKPLASTAFVLAAVSAGALGSTYGQLVLLGLALCWLGDVLLIPQRSEPCFLAGIGSFLLGHVAFAAAFASIGFSGIALAGAGVAAAIAAAFVLRWLWPHLAGVFVPAVPLYTLVIAAMVALATSATAAGATPAIAAGALMFAVSDVSVARDRLVEASFANGAWGLPLYYAAQLVIAASIRSSA
jgi:uncharacterized membrane protein YhhN